MSTDPEPAPVRYTLKPKAFERVNSKESENVPSPHEVAHLLKMTATRESGAATCQAVPPQVKRASRRARDYWRLVIPVNGVLGLLIVIAPKTPVFYVPVGAAMLLLTLGITWVMWVVMDDY